MIKRRFYKHEHAERNDPLDSSSSSDSEVEAEDNEESEDDAAVEVKEDAEYEESEDDAAVEVKKYAESGSISSGYESEDSSAHEVDVDSSGQLIDEDDAETGNDSQNVIEPPSNIMAEKDSVPVDVPDCILKSKSVFRCRICPRIVCLTEETLRAHLKSKRHARSDKLLNEGRLKSILNSDGEIENQETPAELHARIVALAENNPKKKNKGRQRQKKRLSKKRAGDDSNNGKAKVSTKSPAKKRRKNEN